MSNAVIDRAIYERACELKARYEPLADGAAAGSIRSWTNADLALAVANDCIRLFAQVEENDHE